MVKVKKNKNIQTATLKRGQAKGRKVCLLRKIKNFMFWSPALCVFLTLVQAWNVKLCFKLL